MKKVVDKLKGKHILYLFMSNKSYLVNYEHSAYFIFRDVSDLVFFQGCKRLGCSCAAKVTKYDIHG